MKTLNTLLIVNPKTDSSAFQKIVTGYSDVNIEMVNDIEKAIDHMNMQSYDLYIIDKNLNKEDHLKIKKLADVLIPDVPLVELNLADEEFIRFKWSGLHNQWKEAQSEGQKKFFDNPGL